jgi:hypothetical protein
MYDETTRRSKLFSELGTTREEDEEVLEESCRFDEEEEADIRWFRSASRRDLDPGSCLDVNPSDGFRETSSSYIGWLENCFGFTQ